MVKVFQSSQNRAQAQQHPNAPNPYPSRASAGAPYGNPNPHVPAPSQPSAAVPYPSVPYGAPRQPARQAMPYPPSGGGFPAYPPGSAF